MDALHLIVQVSLNLLPLLLPPFIEEAPDVHAVRATERPVLVSSFIEPEKRIQMVFLLMQLFPGQAL